MADDIEILQRSVKFKRYSQGGEEIRISYIDCKPKTWKHQLPCVLLIHGFPLTSHQFKYVLTPLAAHGIRCIAPDYTGAGGSSKPASDYSKQTIASDLWALVHSHLQIRAVHVVAHDIGAMIGHAYASMFPKVLSVTLGECPIPGTSLYGEDKGDVGHFHVNFHAHTDLAVALITGREELYLRYFFDKQAYNRGAITDDDVAIFVKAYSQPGALRAAALTYKAFEQDDHDNRQNLMEQGLCKVPALAMDGNQSHHAGRAEGMLRQLYENVEVVGLEDCGHYLALENPEAFVREVARFVKKHDSVD